ncbi:MAG: primosomal protein N' [Candidatus Aerophobetes bacterium]|nr:primosomal protein N' [Candidatus Aerophobetes bacterium]
MKYIKVALNLPLNQFFYYKVPPELIDKIKIGKRVIVPFKRKNLTGFVIEEVKRGKLKKRLKEIIKIDDSPSLDINLLRLGEWISEYYYCSLGQTLHFMLPVQSGLKIDKKEKEKKSNSFASFTKTQYNKAVSLVGEEGNFLFRTKDNEQKLFFYLSLLERILEEGKDIILIVPEISYIPFFKKVIQYYYPGEIAVFHSRLSLKEKYNQWLRMEEEEVNLAIGTRSIIFAPFPKIGLVIIEEEENPSYKQIETPRYHVREVAMKRGEIEKFPVILTTQSPCLESWYKVKKGDYKLIELSRNNRHLPSIEIVDLREEKTKIFSSFLEERIKENLNKNRKVLLFLNKRGFANFVLCRECGEVIRCPNCNIGLSFHLKNDLICHYCNYQMRIPQKCPFCKGRELQRVGAGTQRIEKEVRKRFQTARMQRVDTDIINSSSAYKKLLENLEDEKIDILVGTQLVIKEEILKRIDLAGVILADTLLNLPDFRAGEYLFQLLTRIKSYIKEEGEIIIQTYNPSHYALKAFKERKEESFYNEEERIRKELGYPPYLHWIRISLEGKVKSRVEEAGKRIEEKLEKENLRFLGPSPCPFSKIKGKYRYHLILRDENLSRMRKILEKELKPLFAHFKGIKTTVDVDPLRTM